MVEIAAGRTMTYPSGSSITDVVHSVLQSPPYLFRKPEPPLREPLEVSGLSPIFQARRRKLSPASSKAMGIAVDVCSESLRTKRCRTQTPRRRKRSLVNSSQSKASMKLRFPRKVLEEGKRAVHRVRAGQTFVQGPVYATEISMDATFPPMAPTMTPEATPRNVGSAFSHTSDMVWNANATDPGEYSISASASRDHSPLLPAFEQSPTLRRCSSCSTVQSFLGSEDTLSTLNSARLNQMYQRTRLASEVRFDCYERPYTVDFISPRGLRGFVRSPFPKLSRPGTGLSLSLSPPPESEIDADAGMRDAAEVGREGEGETDDECERKKKLQARTVRALEVDNTSRVALHMINKQFQQAVSDGLSASSSARSNAPGHSARSSESLKSKVRRSVAELSRVLKRHVRNDQRSLMKKRLQTANGRLERFYEVCESIDASRRKHTAEYERALYERQSCVSSVDGDAAVLSRLAKQAAKFAREWHTVRNGCSMHQQRRCEFRERSKRNAQKEAKLHWDKRPGVRQPCALQSLWAVDAEKAEETRFERQRAVAFYREMVDYVRAKLCGSAELLTSSGMRSDVGLKAVLAAIREYFMDGGTVSYDLFLFVDEAARADPSMGMPVYDFLKHIRAKLETEYV